MCRHNSGSPRSPMRTRSWLRRGERHCEQPGSEPLLRQRQSELKEARIRPLLRDATPLRSSMQLPRPSARRPPRQHIRERAGCRPRWQRQMQRRCAKSNAASRLRLSPGRQSRVRRKTRERRAGGAGGCERRAGGGGRSRGRALGRAWGGRRRRLCPRRCGQGRIPPRHRGGRASCCPRRPPFARPRCRCSWN